MHGFSNIDPSVFFTFNFPIMICFYVVIFTGTGRTWLPDCVLWDWLLWSGHGWCNTHWRSNYWISQFLKANLGPMKIFLITPRPLGRRSSIEIFNLHHYYRLHLIMLLWWSHWLRSRRHCRDHMVKFT